MGKTVAHGPSTQISLGCFSVCVHVTDICCYGNGREFTIGAVDITMLSHTTRKIPLPPAILAHFQFRYIIPNILDSAEFFNHKSPGLQNNPDMQTGFD